MPAVTLDEIQQIINDIHQNQTGGGTGGGGSETKIAPPEVFGGDVTKTSHFVDSIRDNFIANPTRFTDDKKKIIYLKSYLKDGPRDWARAKTNHYAANTWDTYATFETEFIEAYKSPNEVERARLDLEGLRQHTLKPPTVVALNARFRTLLARAELKEDNNTLIPYYKKALDRKIFAKILDREKLPDTLTKWMNVAQEIDGRRLEFEDLTSGRSRAWGGTTQQDRKSTRLNSSHSGESRMPSSA